MENTLDYLDEFQKILSDYHVSEPSKEILNQTRLALLASPTAIGRNTIIKELLKTDQYHYIVSDTTRKPRSNNGIMEQNGVEYWFRGEQDILSDLRAGKFLEAAIIHNQQVSGISIRELELANKQHRIAVTDIEIVGVDNIMQAYQGAHAIFVLPPSFDEWMQRLDGRGDMDKAEKRRRLESAAKELQAALDQEYYNFVINDSVVNAVTEIHKIVDGQVNAEEQIGCRELVGELLYATKNWLK